MRFFGKFFNFLSKILSTVKAIKKYWNDGGYTKVSIAQIQYGGLLKGKSVLITGGSSGIGLAIAKKCLSEGATVVITGRNIQKLKEASEKLNSPMLKTLVWDVCEISLIEERFAEAHKLVMGNIDILVNNAGILGGHRQFCELTEKVWDEIMTTNAKGLVFITQFLVRDWLRNKKTGKIINISSMRGNLGVQDGPYGMSKWAINGLTHGLGLKLAPYGITVNGIAPGIIDTNSIVIKNMNSKENAFLNGLPLSRIGLPEEIAELAVFLMSDAANYIVGQTIICDGGYSLKV